MKVTTLRLPEPLYEDLVAEAEARDRSFSEYARLLFRNRQANTDDAANTQATTTDYAARIRELEARVAALEASSPATSDAASGNAIEGGRRENLAGDPQGTPAEMAIAFVRERQPVERRAILDEVADAIEIKPESWWRRHGRPALEDAGAEFRRNIGWRLPDS